MAKHPILARLRNLQDSQGFVSFKMVADVASSQTLFSTSTSVEFVTLIDGEAFIDIRF